MTDKHQEYMDRAVLAGFIDLSLLAIPQAAMPMRPDNEIIPGRDGMEDGDEH